MTASSRSSETGVALGERDFTDEIVRLETIVDQLSAETGIEEAAWSKFRGVMRPLKEYSPLNYAHSLRVAVYAYGIAKAEGQTDLHLPLFAGYAHDIGKTGIDRQIIEATGVFTEAQREQVEPHAELGFRILQEAGFPFTSFIAAEHHLHQQKPYGVDLSEERLLADPADRAHVDSVVQLVALADSFDATATRNNDQNAEFGSGNDYTEQRAKLLRDFPDSQRRIDWLFEHKL